MFSNIAAFYSEGHIGSNNGTSVVFIFTYFNLSQTLKVSALPWNDVPSKKRFIVMKFFRQNWNVFLSPEISQAHFQGVARLASRKADFIPRKKDPAKKPTIIEQEKLKCVRYLLGFNNELGRPRSCIIKCNPFKDFGVKYVLVLLLVCACPKRRSWHCEIKIFSCLFWKKERDSSFTSCT